MTDKTYCNGCGKFHTEVENMIAMAARSASATNASIYCMTSPRKKNAKTRCESENAKLSWKNSAGFTPTCQPCAPTSIVASIGLKARLNCSHKDSEYENRKPGNARRVAMKAYIRIDDTHGVAVRTILP
jgi:predicted Fe-S protein YdhL (DUF1289 family)